MISDIKVHDVQTFLVPAACRTPLSFGAVVVEELAVDPLEEDTALAAIGHSEGSLFGGSFEDGSLSGWDSSSNTAGPEA